MVLAFATIAQVASAASTVPGAILVGGVRQSTTDAPIVNAVVAWHGLPGSAVLTNIEGRFRLPGRADRVVVMAIGFRPDTVDVTADSVIVQLEPAPLTLAPLVVAAARAASPRLAEILIRDLDLRLRAPRSSQALLEHVPGLVIAQHGGGGKAEQIFLRGFDADHGTDVAINVDGVPVNLVSHAHGQGYADLHFVMPEVVEQIEVRRGGHDPRDGNLATAGAIGFVTKDRIDRPTIWARGASYRTATLGSLVPFGGARDALGGYFGASAFRGDGPFERPQGHQRFNGYLKWTAPLDGRVEAFGAGSWYAARWNASGQIPARAVSAGLIGPFGAIDSSEGGKTSRADLMLGMRSRMRDDAQRWQILAFATRYRFDLYSNFTLFLNDSTDGDGIAQIDDRVVVGAVGDWSATGPGGGWSAGFSIRSDFADVTLADQRARRIRSTRLASRVSEQNAAGWLRYEFRPLLWLDVAMGARADLVRFSVGDRTARSGSQTGVAYAGRISPKIALFADLGLGLSVLAAASTSYHSNDAREAVLAPGPGETLPRSNTIELGLRRAFGEGVLGLGLWRTDLASELVFVGDEGVTEASGRTRRVGVDLEGSVQLLPWLWADGNLNLVRGRFRDQEAGSDRIPLAPSRVATFGLAAKGQGPWSATLGLRHIGDRPANETGTITATGSTLVRTAVARQIGSAAITLSIDNLFDVAWNEAQFATTSRLRGESVPVTELHFTPGSPRRVEVAVTIGW